MRITDNKYFSGHFGNCRPRGKGTRSPKDSKVKGYAFDKDDKAIEKASY